MLASSLGSRGKQMSMPRPLFSNSTFAWKQQGRAIVLAAGRGGCGLYRWNRPGCCTWEPISSLTGSIPLLYNLHYCWLRQVLRGCRQEQAGWFVLHPFWFPIFVCTSSLLIFLLASVWHQIFPMKQLLSCFFLKFLHTYKILVGKGCYCFSNKKMEWVKSAMKAIEG